MLKEGNLQGGRLLKRAVFQVWGFAFVLFSAGSILADPNRPLFTSSNSRLSQRWRVTPQRMFVGRHLHLLMRKSKPSSDGPISQTTWHMTARVLSSMKYHVSDTSSIYCVSKTTKSIPQIFEVLFTHSIHAYQS